MIRKPLTISPWIRDKGYEWTNSSDLHIFLYKTFGNMGTLDDPIQNEESVKNYLRSEWNKTSKQFLLNPFLIDPFKPLIMEKIFLYYDTNHDGMWMKNEEKQGLILLFQYEKNTW